MVGPISLRKILLWSAGALCAGLLASCSVTKHLAEGEYLLDKSTIEIEKAPGLEKKELIGEADLDKYVRQHPATRFLGTNLPAGIYSHGDRSVRRYTGWNRLKRRIGNEPVILDTMQTIASAEGMKIYMDSRGFLNSSSSFSIDTARQKARVTYYVSQGEPYRLGTIRYRFRDDFVRSVILSDTARSLLKTGNIFDVNVLDSERARIAGSLKNKGYYNFSVNDITYVADSLPGERTINLLMVVRRYQAGYDAQGEAILENNRVYRLRNIYVHSGYNPTAATADSLYERRLDTVEYKGLQIVYDARENVRSEILRRAISLSSNNLYDARSVQRTYDNLLRLGYYRTANILFTEVPGEAGQDNLITYVGGEEALPDTTAYTRERYLDCQILCTPATRQGYSFDIEGTFTDDYYGLLAKINYRNRNMLRGAGLFDASLFGSYEFMRKNNNAFEVGASVSLSFPKLITPFRVDPYNRAFSPRTRVELSYSIQRRPYYHRTLSNLSWGYQWGNGKRSTFTLKPVDISIVKLQSIDSAFYADLQNPYLKRSYRSQMIAGMSGSYVYSTQKRDVRNSYFNLRLNYETNGNLLDGIYAMVGAKKKEVSSNAIDPDDPSSVPDKAYQIFGIPFAQYFRVDGSLSKQFVLGAKTSLVYRFYAGWGFAYGNSVAIPFERMFYAGGVNSMRGWVARTLGPGNAVPLPTEEGAAPTPTYSYPSQLGNFKLETNLEFRFPVWGMLQGGVFCDVGNIWFARQGLSNPSEVFHFNTFYKQLGFNTGLGLRFDFNFFVFRVDWGVQLHDPNHPPGERWVIRHFRWENSALNFGVGYPF